uniref:Uncharacterized protein n=1 Tax=Halimeda micronesica TaxID=170426 RepID=A0A386AXD3_9CHLO|nr:hypothetical protein [Halimeda micronesica]
MSEEAKNTLTITREKLEKFKCVKQKLEKIHFNIVQVNQMLPKLEVRFSNECLSNLREKMRYLEKVLGLMETILEKLKNIEQPKLASEEVFAFYSLTAFSLVCSANQSKQKANAKISWEPLVRFPILGISQRDSELLSPEQYVPKFLAFISDLKAHLSVS